VRGEGARERTTSTLTTYTLSDRTVALLFMVECGKKMQDSHIMAHESVPSLTRTQLRDLRLPPPSRRDSALLGHFADSSGKSLPKLRDNLSVPFWHTDPVKWRSAGQHSQQAACTYHLTSFKRKRLGGITANRLLFMDGRPFACTYLLPSIIVLSVPKMTHKSLQSKMETLKKKLALLCISKLRRAERT